MAGLQDIRDAVVEQGTAIAEELEQLALKDVIDPAEVQELAGKIRMNTEQIKGMVPDEPPPVEDGGTGPSMAS